MDGVQHVEQVQRKVCNPVDRKRADVADRLGERSAGQRLHDDPRGVPIAYDVEDVDGAVVVDAGRGPCLIEHPRGGDLDGRIGDRLLERDRSVQQLILRQEDAAHATAAQKRLEPEAARYEPSECHRAWFVIPTPFVGRYALSGRDRRVWTADPAPANR